ncbi:hypothetical protein [Cystobacter ferrugineus]|uniref:hypothetical protein n=1 Tax=Cystobacter ferrugineus TaxID=83449 RepID=UPI0011613430|nr:hypothetical protein [Cystobacter ferrugineus]
MSNEKFSTQEQQGLGESLKERITDAVRERVVTALEDGLGDEIRERVGDALRSAQAERSPLIQGQPALFDPENISDAIHKRCWAGLSSPAWVSPGWAPSPASVRSTPIAS